MSDPAVTVLIATYRAGMYLRPAIASALAQTFGDLEVLVCDDADDPEVARLSASFGDPRIRYRGNPDRLGPARNHWAGIGLARGRYVAILNHDDLLHPEFLARLVPPLGRDGDATLAFCDHDIIDGDGVPLPGEADRVSRMWGRTDLEGGRHRPFAGLVASQAIPLAMGSLFRRDAIDPAALPDVGPAYDLWLAYELCRGGGAAWYVPDRLTAWRVHPSQLTSRGDLAWAAGAVACWRAIEADPLFRPYRASARGKLSGSAVGAARSLLNEGDRRSARTFSRCAISRQPKNWKAWAVHGLSYLPAMICRRFIGRGPHAGASRLVHEP